MDSFANDIQQAFISEGICPVCKEGELKFIGLAKPKSLTDWKDQEPTWECSKCSWRVVTVTIDEELKE